MSLSEGSTWANYSTSDISDANHPKPIHNENIHGARDPIIIEYGLSNHWGLGLSTGSDFFDINPSDYYGFKLQDNKKIRAGTGEFTIDGNYHFLVTKKLDLSAFGSFGIYSVSFNNGKDASDANPYAYSANGGIIRTGLKGRYYFFKHFGVFGMFSLYSGNTSPINVKGNTLATNYTTKISGDALEAGLCFRFLK